jgi:hypothetical protein
LIAICPGNPDYWGIGQVATCPYGFYLPGALLGARGHCGAGAAYFAILIFKSNELDLFYFLIIIALWGIFMLLRLL